MKIVGIGLGVILVMYCVASPALDTSETAPGLGKNEQALAIDGALLGSELSAKGLRAGIGQSLGHDEDAAKISSCIQDVIAPQLRDAYVLAISGALMPAELKRGAEMAISPIFLDVKNYVMANSESLRAEAVAAHQNVIDYFLGKAASTLDMQEKDKEIINEFIVWHKDVTPKLTQEFLKLQPAFIKIGITSLSQCMSHN